MKKNIKVDLCALQRVISYLETDEKRHYEENDKPKNHIWISISFLVSNLVRFGRLEIRPGRSGA